MELFVQQILSGIATGGIYACMALSVVMIYQAIHHLNFAQGEMAMFSTFLAWQLLQWGLPYWAAFVLAVALSFAGGFALERIVFKPIEKAPVLSHIVVFIALFAIFNSFAGFIWDFTIKIGGDVDTIAAMAGGIWGAARGVDELPQEKLAELEDFDRLRNLAAKFAEIVEDGKARQVGRGQCNRVQFSICGQNWNNQTSALRHTLVSDCGKHRRGAGRRILRHDGCCEIEKIVQQHSVGGCHQATIATMHSH